MEFLLWVLAVILVIAGIVQLFRRQFLWGIVLIIVGFLVGPGGVSRWERRAGTGRPHAEVNASSSDSCR